MTAKRKRYRVTKPPKLQNSEYGAIWRLVDGAVADAFRNHPEYIANGIRERDVRNSVNKRVVGIVNVYAEKHRAGENRLT